MLNSAKSGMDGLKSAWSEAESAASSGDFMSAMSKASTVEDQGTAMMHSLGMSTG
jgi:hypothetical protein